MITTTSLTQSPVRFFGKIAITGILLLLVSALRLSALDYYITPTGAGTQTGLNWENAKPVTTLQTVLNTTMVAGDTLFLEGANYGTRRVTIDSSGTAVARKKLVGVDRGQGFPLFKGTNAGDNQAGLTFNAGKSYWEIKNLKIQYHEWCVKTLGENLGLLFDNLNVWNTNYGMHFTDTDDLVVQNCKSARYVHSGYFLNNNCNVVKFSNCEADCTEGDASWSATSTNGPSGFDFHFKTSTAPANTDIILEDCVSHNNREDGGTFTQGDGFMVQSGDTGLVLNDRIRFIRCKSYDNNDGAYDLKGSNQTLENCIGMRSRYGFKIWRDTTLTNCIATHNGSAGIYCASGGDIIANYCTLHKNGTTGVLALVEGGVTGTINLKNCVLTYDGGTGSFNNAGVLFNTGTADVSMKHYSASNTANAPRYNNPVYPWDGTGANYDNLTYGLAKGYNSTVGVAAELSPVADATVRDGTYANTNYGSSGTLTVKNDATGYKRESFLRFDLAPYPAAISSAKLKLVVSNINSSPVVGSLYYVSSDTWTEAGITWNTRPAGSTVLASWTPAALSVIEIDVTARVNEEIAGNKLISFKLGNTASGSTTDVSYGSKENANAALRPLLEIVP